MRDRMRADLTISALAMAIQRQKAAPSVAIPTLATRESGESARKIRGHTRKP